MVNAIQYSEKIGQWSIQIHKRTKKLNRSNKWYSIANYFLTANVAMTTVILIGINSYFLADPNISNKAKLGLNITVLVLQVFLAFCNSTLSIVRPSFKSFCFGYCSKLYSGLQREIETKIEQAKCSYDEDYSSNYLADLANLAGREQVILHMTPSSILSEKDEIIIKSNNFDNGVITQNELDLVIKYINRHNKKEKEVLTRIFNKVFHSIDIQVESI